MDTIILTKEKLNKIVTDVIESAQESLIYVLANKLQNEGSKSVIEYILFLENATQNGGYVYNFDEYIKNIVNDCFEQYETAVCEPLKSC